MTPLDLYTYQTPNGHKASIMLEEVGLPYSVRVIDIERGDQMDPAFLDLNANNKIPVIVDPDMGRTVIESGAILHYLARRSGRLLPADVNASDEVLTWTLFQAAHVGPTLGQLWNYKVFASEKIPYVIGRFEKEAARVLGVLDRQLERGKHIAGEAYGIADVMTWPWIHAGVTKLGVSLDATPNVTRWYTEVSQRPAVRRGLAIPQLDQQPTSSD